MSPHGTAMPNANAATKANRSAGNRPTGARTSGARTTGARTTSATAIAVVGLACRFPDADDPAALLDVVLTGRRSFRRLPPGRIDISDYYLADPSTSDATYSTRAAVIEGWRFEPAA